MKEDDGSVKSILVAIIKWIIYQIANLSKIYVDI